MGVFSHLRVSGEIYHGRLRPEEIDEVWVAFLADPELYDAFLIELHLRYLGRMKQ